MNVIKIIFLLYKHDLVMMFCAVWLQMHCNIIIHVEGCECVCVSLVIPDICMNL